MSKPRNEQMLPSEWSALRNWLLAQGLKGTDIAAARGGTLGGRNRQQVGESLRDWFRSRPKKTA